jgi:hypothetical protein
MAKNIRLNLSKRQAGEKIFEYALRLKKKNPHVRVIYINPSAQEHLA